LGVSGGKGQGREQSHLGVIASEITKNFFLSPCSWGRGAVGGGVSRMKESFQRFKEKREGMSNEFTYNLIQ
jgi:hypothetical protein